MQHKDHSCEKIFKKNLFPFEKNLKKIRERERKSFVEERGTRETGNSWKIEERKNGKEKQKLRAKARKKENKR